MGGFSISGPVCHPGGAPSGVYLPGLAFSGVAFSGVAGKGQSFRGEGAGGGIFSVK